nr:MAG TPA: putative protein serine/threonine phosphatase [Caudoviricetes sp.]
MSRSTQPRCDNMYGQKSSGVSLFGRCPKCNAETCPHYLYCKTCGYKLREEPKFCQCGNRVSSKDNYCDQCGRRT